MLGFGEVNNSRLVNNALMTGEVLYEFNYVDEKIHIANRDPSQSSIFLKF